MKLSHFSSPGQILKREFLDEYGLSVSAAAAALGLSRARLNEIVHGERGITADTALRLGKYFRTSAQFWLNLQSHYDLAHTATKQKARQALKKIVPIEQHAN